MRGFRPGLALALVIVLGVSAGCRMPGGRSAPVRYWLLDPIEGEPQPSDQPLLLGIGPIELPAYLQRNEVVSRSGPNQLVVSSVDLWGGSLDTSFTNVLGRNLEILVPGAVSVAFPWKGRTQPQRQVLVVVNRFEVVDGQSARLEATWSVSQADGRTRGTGSWSTDEPVGGGDRAAEIAALSRALGALSREIAKAVTAGG